MTKSMQNVLINGSLLLGTLLGCFGAVELGLRVTGLVQPGAAPPLIYQVSDNPVLSYELKPNMREKAFRNIITTNSLGLRSPEPDGTKPVVAVVGDSITFGYGVADDETLPARLDALLPQHTVLNGGVPGYHIKQEVALYQTKFAPLQPAALILVFYFNDVNLSTAFLDDQYILRDEGWQPPKQECHGPTTGLLSLVPGRCWLMDHSAFYKGVVKYVSTRTGTKTRDALREQASPQPDADSVTPADVQRYAQEFAKLATQLPTDMPRVFVIWPDHFLHTSSRPLLTQTAEQYGFTVIDLYDTFGNEAETLSWDYVHPSAATIEKAARVIHKALKELAGINVTEK